MAQRLSTKKPAEKTAPLNVRKRSGTVAEYLEAVRPDGRAALEKVRRTIRAAAPGATEGISYQVPTFKLDGHPLVGYGASATHCAFYVMSTAVLRAHARELDGYKLGKGSIQFLPGKPLPASVVTKLVKARIAENRKSG